MIAAAAMAASSLSVVTNASRLRHARISGQQATAARPGARPAGRRLGLVGVEGVGDRLECSPRG